MNIYLVDVKNEYTAHLIRLLTPLIYEGIQSIYDKAKESMEEQSLKLFQEFLSDIPSWNTTLINQESDRIKSGTKPYFEDLIKATIKANIMLLVFNPFNDKQQTIDIELYKKIKTSTFIHNVYIECAREFWNNPFLLFHKYAAIDTKRNQRESFGVDISPSLIAQFIVCVICVCVEIYVSIPVAHWARIQAGYMREHACEGSTQKGHLTSKKRDNIHSNYFAVECLVLKNNYNRNFTPTQIAKIYDCHIQRRGNVMRKSLVDVQRPS